MKLARAGIEARFAVPREKRSKGRLSSPAQPAIAELIHDVVAVNLNGDFTDADLARDLRPTL
jgi:hypothetical protein